MMTKLDQKSAKQIARSHLRTGDLALTGYLEKSKPEINPSSVNRKRALVEKQAAQAYGNMLINSWWNGRNFSSFILTPVSPELSNRPYYAVLIWRSFNLRSNATKDRHLLEVTTHAMERIVERSNDPDLFGVVRKELDLAFLDLLCNALSDYLYLHTED
jgi:hypothetical protein